MSIQVKQVLSGAISFYSKSYKRFVGFCFTFFVLTVFLPANQDLTITKDFPTLLLLSRMMPIVSIVFLPRLYLSLLIVINSQLDNQIMSWRKAYQLTKGKYWKFIGCTLLAVLILLPASLLLTFGKTLPLTLAGCVSTTLIMALFFTMYPVIAIGSDTKQYLAKSMELIKGNYRSVLALTFISPVLLLSIEKLSSYIFSGKPLILLCSAIVLLVLRLFSLPFTGIVTVMVYRQLNGETKERCITYTEFGIKRNKH